MPCNSEYLEPNNKEIELSKVLTFLAEVETGTFDKNGLDPFRKDVYNKSDVSEQLQKKVPELCEKLQKLSNSRIKKYSLELQLWWRDHQEVDKLRIESELNLLNNKEEIEKALDKLTDHERAVLGY